ncbi:HEAT repeat domain-containing protein [Methanoculleus sp. MH98A]|uniref:HEAT repeat domain-containing protein n=1 Tax=Methanoculleus sp. MH98A TaxID=1495314 RepID=UPI0004A195B0|nr:HEAT repeat domain-containing protein [Methanoculleus sp. MH98A]KDE56185.1 PBS lyase [Methanoculleus sp. MH98A]
MAFFDKLRANIEGLRQTKDCPGLIAVLDGEEAGNRADAARAICTLGVSAVPDLLERLENANRVSRARILGALASAGAPSIPLLLALILRASPALQAAITRAVAEEGDSLSETLQFALHHKQPAVRRAAVIAIRGTGKKAIPALTEAFRDRNHSVRREAAAGLAALRWVPDDLSEKVWFYFLLEDWAELAKLQAAAVPILVKGLDSKEPRIRSESARTLGKIRDSRAVPSLVRVMEDPQVDLRVRAAEALGEIGNDRGKPALVGALDDPCHPVRMEAAWALDRLDWIPENDLERAGYLIAKEQWNELARMGRAAIPPLIRALEVEYSGVRTGASETLRQLGQPALDALHAAMNSDSPEIREQAAVVLDYIRSRNEENSRARPVQTVSSDYDRELREGLAARKRIEDRFGPVSRPPDRPARRGPPPAARAEAGQPVTGGEEKPVAQQPDDAEEVEKLLEERPEAEAGAGENIRPKTRKPVSLDEIVPPTGVEQEIDDEERTNEEVPAPRKPGRTVLPEPDDPAAPPEPPEQAPGKASLERYLNALQSDDAEIRAAAVAALRSLGAPAVEFLIAALSDPHDAVRIAAAEGLGDIGDENGVDALILLTGDAGQDVRSAAAAALGQIGDARALEALIRLFGDDYPGVRSVAAKTVAVFGPDVLEPLEAALEEPVPVVRLTAARAIGIIGNPRSIPLLIRHLEDPAREVGVTAARVLGGFGNLAVEPLAAVLREGGKGGRLAAVDALGGIEPGRADEALAYALSDEDREVREKAATTLMRRRAASMWQSTFGNRAREEKEASVKSSVGQESREEINTLITALNDRSVEVQASAATRLIAMGRPAAEGLLRVLKDDDPEMQRAAAGVLGEMREAALGPLTDALNDTDRFVRLVAARNLGNIGDARAIEALSGALKSERDSVVRAAVAEALGYMGSKQAIEPLTLALQDRDEAVKVAAARSLGYIGDLRALEPLIQALSDVDDRVRYAALEALKDPGETIRRHLVGALRSGDETFRAGVAEALKAGGWKPETRAELTLCLMAQGRWAEVERVGADALPVLAETLTDPLIEVRANAVRAINRIGGEGAVAPLVRALKDDALVVRKRAEWGLIRMGGAVIPALDLALDEAQPEAREGLQRIIEEIRVKEKT